MNDKDWERYVKKMSDEGAEFRRKHSEVDGLQVFFALLGIGLNLWFWIWLLDKISRIP